MIFVDSNVPMYLVGAPHPNRDRLEAFIRGHAGTTFVTSAEVYQEVIHRYVAIDRRQAIADAFRLLDDLVKAVFPVRLSDAKRAHRIALQEPRLSGRDCLHLAVMEAERIGRILTFDGDFDFWPGVQRLP